MTKSKDSFGDRMKDFEQSEAGRRLMPLLPIMVRLDGKGFSSFTRGLARPYDEGLSKLMIEVTKFLVDQSNARVGYTQSDEISLVLYSDSYDSQIFFDGKIQKLTSVLASMATAKFNELLPEYVPAKKGKIAFFDCRVWSVPSLVEASNTILWRELDASKNSVQMLARCHFSHKALEGKNKTSQLLMLEGIGINWGNYPSFFKRGTFIQRSKKLIELSPEEIAVIPEKFRPSPGTKVERSVVSEVQMPPFSRVVNRVEVIFDGADPIILSGEEAAARGED